MTKPRHSTLLALAVGSLMALGATAAIAAPGPTSERTCFASNNWRGWTAAADGDALYLRVGRRDIYRVDLAPKSHVRKEFDDFLVSRVRGSNWICSPLDLDLTLSDRQGFQRPLFPRALRKLTPEEVAAIPPKDLP
jgi:hypothetical protein